MTGGVGEALGEAMDGAEAVDGGALVQAALFDVEETGKLDAPSPLSAAIVAPRRSGGRPKGSRNRRTEAVAAWLLSQHRHPLSVMMEAYSMPPAELAERIGLRRATATKKDSEGETVRDRHGLPVQVDLGYYDNAVLLEIVKLQLRMAEAVAPYVAQKLPQAVQVQAEGAVQVTLAGVSLPARAGSPGDGAKVVEGEILGVRLPKSDG